MRPVYISRQQYIVVRESAFSAARVLAFSASCAGLMSYSFYYYVSKMRRNIDAHYEGLHLIFVLLLYIYLYIYIYILITYHLIQPTLFTNQRFMLDEMFWQRHFKICHTFWNMKTHLILCYTRYFMFIISLIEFSGLCQLSTGHLLGGNTVAQNQILLNMGFYFLPFKNMAKLEAFCQWCCHQVQASFFCSLKLPYAK